jgi:hypothetical protein
VVGDLHGHLPRLQALLLAENLIGVCDCSDKQNDSCEHCYNGLEPINREETAVLLLGDVIHADEASQERDLDCLKGAVCWVDVILWGNHDRAVFQDQHTFGNYAPPLLATRQLLNKLHSRGRLLLAASVYGTLLTHAGLHEQWGSQTAEAAHDNPQTLAISFNSQDQQWFANRAEPMPMRDDVGAIRGGDSPCGGILWRHIKEPLYDGFPQVFGHSADQTNHLIRYGGAHAWNPVLRQEQDSLCIDIGGRGGQPGDECLAGIYLPDGALVRADLDIG